MEWRLGEAPFVAEHSQKYLKLQCPFDEGIEQKLSFRVKPYQTLSMVPVSGIRVITMNHDEVLNLFRSRAQSLEKTYTRSQDVISLLARVIAHCSNQLTQEDLDSLLYIGGVLVKRVDTQARARLEVAATLKSLHDSNSSSST